MARATTMMFAALTANNVQKRMGSPICSLGLALFFESFSQALCVFRMVGLIG